uniref:Histidine kinase n=1 Tax=Eutreptiella gymnastica TaxID=73025 RepID=A0A7S4LFU1_9EUGL
MSEGSIHVTVKQHIFTPEELEGIQQSIHSALVVYNADLVGQRALYFSVQDSGTGISPEALKQLFQPYEQAVPLVPRRFGGTGLGLHICTKQIAIMGGMFGVHSIVGSGSCFWFAVPLKENVAINRRSADAVITSDMAAEIQGMTVLVAEDNAVNQLLIQRLLTSMGVTSVLVADGQKAVEEYKNPQKPYDAILMDIQMPVMDGLAATHALRKLGCTLPIVALTANVERTQEEYIDDGMTGFCPKPVKKAFLMNVLWTVLGDARRKANKARAMEKDGEAADANSLSPTPRSSGVSQPAPKTGQNVLLIEQNMLTQMLLKRFFTKLGVKCDYCNSLSDGLQQLAKHKYQVITVTPNALSVASKKFEGIQQIRDQCRDAPVALVVIDVCEADKPGYTAAGATHFFDIPLTIRQAEAVLKSCSTSTASPSSSLSNAGSPAKMSSTSSTPHKQR